MQAVSINININNYILIMELNMTEKRPYERPQVTIVKMSVHPQLMAGSNKSSIEDYYKQEIEE